MSEISNEVYDLPPTNPKDALHRQQGTESPDFSNSAT